MPPRLIYSLLLFVILFVLLEARPLFKARNFKELAVAGLIMVLALAYGLDYMTGSQLLPNPNLLISWFKPISQSFDKFFQVTG